MKIKYLGHSSLLISSKDNVKIITDPYTPGHGIAYKAINESADIVTITHNHGDHNNIASVKGSPAILREAGSKTIKGIEIKSVSLYHDAAQGSQRGVNLAFCLKVDGITVCHLGDLGHTLKPEQISAIGQVDILLIPVGGFFTIDAKEASVVAKSLKSKVIIPMHYKTPKADFPIAAVDEFLKDKKNVRRLNSSEVEFNSDTLPKETEIIVLQPAL